MDSIKLVASMSAETFSEVMAVSRRQVREILFSQLGAIQMTLGLNPKINHLILSGGNASLLANHLDTKAVKNCKIILDPYLVFRGMALHLKDAQP